MSFIKKFKYREIILIFASLFFVASGAFYFFGFKVNIEIASKKEFTQELQHAQDLAVYAERVVEKCKTANYKPTCYEEEVPKLMDYISMEQAFEVTKLVQDIDSTYAYCHVLAHKFSARETAKDPNKWKEVITRVPSGLCSNGGIHGAFQERFRTEFMNDEQIGQIKPDLEDVCEQRNVWKPTGLERSSCYHALGHLLMYITSANIDKSTKLCEEVAIKKDGNNYSRVCFDGNFMQIFQPLEPEDFALVDGLKPKKEDLEAFCSNFSGTKRISCWNEAWPLFGSEILKPQGLVKFCSGGLLKTEIEQDQCYEAMVYVVTAQVQLDAEKMKNYCSGLPSKNQGRCFASVASRIIETDFRFISKSVDVCSAAPATPAKSRCFEELVSFSTYNFKVGSKEYFKLCESLPDPWKVKCLNKYIGGQSLQ